MENELLKIISKFPKKVFWFSISCNPNITVDIIKKYKKLPWDDYGIQSNPNIKMKTIEKWYNGDNSSKKSFFWIMKNPNLTIKYIKKHSNVKWKWNMILNNSKSIMKMIKKYPIKKLDWYSICINPNLTFKYLLLKTGIIPY